MACISSGGPKSQPFLSSFMLSVEFLSHEKTLFSLSSSSSGFFFSRERRVCNFLKGFVARVALLLSGIPLRVSGMCSSLPKRLTINNSDHQMTWRLFPQVIFYYLLKIHAFLIPSYGVVLSLKQRNHVFSDLIIFVSSPRYDVYPVDNERQKRAVFIWETVCRRKNIYVYIYIRHAVCTQRKNVCTRFPFQQFPEHHRKIEELSNEKWI